MDQESFVARRRPEWEELQTLLRRLNGAGPGTLNAGQLQRLGTLYRHATADLAYARAHFPGSATAGYLNALVAGAHARIYARPAGGARAAWRFLAVTVPRTVRQAGRPLLLAFALFWLGAVLGFWAMRYDPGAARALVPAQIRQATAEVKRGEIEPIGQRPVVGTQILLNNVLVGVKSFGLGVTFGAGTAYSLLLNGVMVGALWSLFEAKGLWLYFWSLIVPHGALELTAIWLCGAAGFLLGGALIDPGPLRRRDALVQRGKAAVVIVVGSLPFWLCAALIEGLLTPAALSPWTKLAVGAVTGSLGWAYLLLAGREARANRAP